MITLDRQSPQRIVPPSLAAKIASRRLFVTLESSNIIGAERRGVELTPQVLFALNVQHHMGNRFPGAWIVPTEDGSAVYLMYDQGKVRFAAPGGIGASAYASREYPMTDFQVMTRDQTRQVMRELSLR